MRTSIFMAVLLAGSVVSGETETNRLISAEESDDLARRAVMNICKELNVECKFNDEKETPCTVK